MPSLLGNLLQFQIIHSLTSVHKKIIQTWAYQVCMTLQWTPSVQGLKTLRLLLETMSLPCLTFCNIYVLIVDYLYLHLLTINVATYIPSSTITTISYYYLIQYHFYINVKYKVKYINLLLLLHLAFQLHWAELFVYLVLHNNYLPKY